MTSITSPSILIVDFGSQYSQIITRSLREMGYRSALLSPAKAQQWLEDYTPKAIILSGGNKSVNNQNAPQIPQGVFDAGVPILGICYGMQALAKHFGGQVSNQSPGFGTEQISLVSLSPLFDGLSDTQDVWASHGDTVSKLPKGWKKIATDKTGALAAMQGPEEKFFGVQFHPEVTQSTKGQQILENFLFICDCKQDWDAFNMKTTLIQQIAEQVGPHEKVGLGASGGVDSTVLAALCREALGPDRVFGICLDANNLRHGERDLISKHLHAAGISLQFVDISQEVLTVLAGITDPEDKRKAFQPVYKKALVDAMQSLGDGFIVAQGTLATDLIESGKTGGEVIKTHHNTGLDFGDTQQIEPLSGLFKYEVRELARSLNLPDSVTNRSPFPGPGLLIRILGEVTCDKLNLLREVDRVAMPILEKTGENVAQFVVGLGPQTVGIKGDARDYTHAALIRGVITTDFMTAKGVYFEQTIVEELKSALTQIPGINRVWIDPTDKPSATTEWQ